MTSKRTLPNLWPTTPFPHIILPDTCSIGEVVEKLQVAFLQPIELFLPQIIQPTYYRERSQTAIIIILSEGFWFFHTAKVHDCFLWWLSWHKITSMAQLEKIRRQNLGLWLWLITVFFNMRFNSTYKALSHFRIFEFFHNLCLLRKLVLFCQKYTILYPIKCLFYCLSCGEFPKWHMSAHTIIVLQLPFYLFRVKENGLFRATTYNTTLHPKTILWNTSFSLKMFRLKYLD